MYDEVDERGVPTSAGVPPIVRIAAVIGIIGIFVIIGMVIAAAPWAHKWPATDTLKIPL